MSTDKYKRHSMAICYSIGVIRCFSSEPITIPITIPMKIITMTTPSCRGSTVTGCPLTRSFEGSRLLGNAAKSFQLASLC